MMAIWIWLIKSVVIVVTNKRIYIEINNTCNFTCSFCPYPLLKCEKYNMPLDQIKQLLNDIKNNIDYRIIYFHNLNEPLLYPKIDQLIKYCDKQAIRYGITTNGVFLDKHIEALKKCKMKELNISYQVADDTENSIRGNLMTVSEYRKYLVKNIIAFKDSFNGEIKIKLLVTNERSIFNKIKIHGFENIEDIIKEINEFYKLFVDHELTHEQIEKIKNIDITRFCKINLFDNIFIELFPFLTWGNYYDKIHSACFGKCDGLSGQLQIKVNGDVLPCCYDFNSKLLLGNINDNNLSDILKSSEYKKMEQKILSKKIYYSRCRKCLGQKKYCELIKKQYRFLFKSQVEDRFIFSDNKISL